MADDHKVENTVERALYASEMPSSPVGRPACSTYSARLCLHACRRLRADDSASSSHADLHCLSVPQAKGNAAFSAGRFDEAIQHFTAGIEADPTNHVLYSNRSAAAASKEDYTAALGDAKKARNVPQQWTILR